MYGEKRWSLHKLDAKDFEQSDKPSYLLVLIHIFLVFFISWTLTQSFDYYYLKVIAFLEDNHIYNKMFVKYLIFICEIALIIFILLNNDFLYKTIKKISIQKILLIIGLVLFLTLFYWYRYSSQNLFEFITFYIDELNLIFNLKIVIAITSIISLIFNNNFVLYKLLYQFILKIQIITIDDNISPFTKVLTELENIILGANKSCSNCNNPNINFRDKIVFFWIRKDYLKSRERLIERLVPFLSLIVILFALKEKRMQLVSVIGGYFALIGIVFIVFLTTFLNYIKGMNCQGICITLSIFIPLLAWYLLSMFSAFKLVDTNEYLKIINKKVRRAQIKHSFNFNRGYNDIIKTFERDNAIYIYDYRLDKYQFVDESFFLKNLKKSRKYIERSVWAIVSLILTVILFMVIEIYANSMFNSQKSDLKSPLRLTEEVKYEYRAKRV